MSAAFKMTPELQAYLDFDPRAEDDGWEKQQELRKKIQPGLLREYYRAEVEAACIPENETVACRREHLSPSGKYKLIVGSFTTKAGCWNYTQGKVFRVGSDEPLAVISRNYSSFPFLFIEGHPKGDLIVGGFDYQGQTVVNLTTGERRDFLPEEAGDGVGFCWADYTYNPETQILVVAGCHWACPYEYRFYDFSDPMSGWPELKVEEYIDADSRPPTFEADGTIKTYQTGEVNTDDDGEGDKLGPIVATRTYRRDGSTLVLVSEDVTPEEQKRREDNEAACKAHDEFAANYKATDPLWLRMKELAAEAPFKPADYMSLGVTYKGWCPTWEGDEQRFCHGIHRAAKGYSFELEIAHSTGPVKLGVSKDGKSMEALFFEHSVEGVEKAFAHARGLLEGTVS